MSTTLSPPPELSIEWVRPVFQERSQQTLQRILEAAEELIGQQGFEPTTIADITRAASVSVGTFYARFRDKDALLHVLQDRLSEQAVATARAAASAVPDDATVHDIGKAFARFVLQVYRLRPQLVLAVLFRVRTDRQVAERAERMNREIARVLGGLLARRRAQLAHADPHRAADFAMRLILAMFQERALFGDVLPGSLPEEAFVAEVARAFDAYLCARVAP